MSAEPLTDDPALSACVPLKPIDAPLTPPNEPACVPPLLMLSCRGEAMTVITPLLSTTAAMLAAADPPVLVMLNVLTIVDGVPHVQPIVASLWKSMVPLLVRVLPFSSWSKDTPFVRFTTPSFVKFLRRFITVGP